ATPRVSPPCPYTPLFRSSTLSRSMSKRSMPARQQTPVRCDLHAPISTCAWIVARARGARSLPRGQLSAMLPNAPCELAGRSCDETEVAGQDCRDLPAYRLAPSPFLPAPDVVRHAPAWGESSCPEHH